MGRGTSKAGRGGGEGALPGGSRTRRTSGSSRSASKNVDYPGKGKTSVGMVVAGGRPAAVPFVKGMPVGAKVEITDAPSWMGANGKYTKIDTWTLKKDDNGAFFSAQDIADATGGLIMKRIK